MGGQELSIIKGGCLRRLTVLYLLTTVLYFLYSTLDILWHI